MACKGKEKGKEIIKSAINSKSTLVGRLFLFTIVLIFSPLIFVLVYIMLFKHIVLRKTKTNIGNTVLDLGKKLKRKEKEELDGEDDKDTD